MFYIFIIMILISLYFIFVLDTIIKMALTQMEKFNGKIVTFPDHELVINIIKVLLFISLAFNLYYSFKLF